MAEGDELVGQIVALFAESLNIQVGESTDLFEEGHLDSLTFVSLLVEVEERFGVSVDVGELDIEDFRTVSGIAGVIHREAAAGR